MRPFSRLKLGLILVLFVAILLVLNLTGAGKGIKGFFYSSSVSIQGNFWQAGNSVSSFFSGVFSVGALKEEAESLWAENQELLSQIVVLNDLKKENTSLREALEIGLEKDFQLEIAKVLGKDPSRDSVFINKGSKDGIVGGLPVITSQKTLVGKIGEVYANSAEVVLISSRESSFDAKTISSFEEEEIKEEAEGIVNGKGGLDLFLEFIPREEEILVGELVVTSSLSGIFPYGFLVGEIEEIQRSDVEHFQKARIKPTFDFKSLDNVFIVLNF